LWTKVTWTRVFLFPNIVVCAQFQFSFSSLQVVFIASGQDSKSSVRLSPESVAKLYCQRDFDGARTKTETYSEMDHLYLWPAEPGWDGATLVRRYRVLSSHIDDTHAVVTVEYEALGDISAWEFKEEHKSTQVEFKLELGSKEWEWKNDEPELITSALAWRITAPTFEPHISVPYAIKHFSSLPRNDSDPDRHLEKVLARLRAIQ